MKRIALLLVIVLLATFALSGCTGAGKDAYDLYTAMSSKLAAAKSLDMDLSGTMAIGAGGQKQDLNLSGNIKEVIKSKDDIDMAMEMKTSVLSMDINVKEYYTNGVLYMDALGKKSKMDMDLSTVKAQSNADILNFERDAVKSSTVSDVSGGKKITFTLDSKSLTSYLDKLMNSVKSSLGVDMSKAKITFGDVICDATVDGDNMLKSYHMKFTMNMDISGQSMTMDYDATISVKSAGGVTITFPADLDTYTEQSKP